MSDDLFQEDKNSEFDHLINDEQRPRRRRRRSRSQNPMQRTVRRIRRTRLSAVLVGVLVVLIVLSVGLAVLLVDASTQLNSAWEGTQRVVNSVSGQNGTDLTLNDFNRLRSSVEDLQNRVQLAQGRTALISPIAQFIPDARVGLQALDAAAELVNAADAMLEGIEPSLVFLVDGDETGSVAAGVSSGERLVELLESGRGRFNNAQSHLQAATEQLSTIDLAGTSPQWALTIDELQRFQTQLSEVNQLMFSASDLLTLLLGLDDDRSYLVLAVNNDELRPSGGYLSTYGWFVVRNGRIINYNYDETSTISPNPPRLDFANTFTVPDWWISYRQPLYAAWDGSWYVDFPSTAELAASYYNAGGNPHSPVDGVISIDLSGFELLLSALGDVLVPEYGRVVNIENFRDVVYGIRLDALGDEDPHKDFLIATYQAIFAEWQELEQSQTSQLLGALLEALQQRHIMIYFADPDLNAALDILDWGGVQQAATDIDYMLVADANTVGNKSNHSIIRQLTYDALINDDGSINGRLSVRYDYSAAIAENDPAIGDHGPLNYRNLQQIFLPVDTDITETVSIGAYERVLQDTHTLLVSSLQVDYDSVARYTYEYRTPPIIETLGTYQRYNLLIQKQPGSGNDEVEVQVLLPIGAQVVASNPATYAFFELERPTLSFRQTLSSDIWIEVIYDTP